jgi:hypothetical protein
MRRGARPDSALLLQKGFPTLALAADTPCYHRRRFRFAALS